MAMVNYCCSSKLHIALQETSTMKVLIIHGLSMSVIDSIGHDNDYDRDDFISR